MKLHLIFDGLDHNVWGVILAVAPLVLLFLIFQIFLLKLPRVHVINILKGTLISAIGLLLFLQGVHIAFLPFGRIIGETLGNFPYKWLIVSFGLILGFLTTWGEPSVRILAEQVENASSGSINNKIVLFAICTGVSLFVGIGMLRIIYGIPLLYILLPGYILFLLTMWFSDKEFLAIAVDSGGVATGPVANTFLLAIGLGVASTIDVNVNPLISGLGMVALIALAPVLSVLTTGFIIKLLRRRNNA